jgi:hypothetical protein
MSSPLSPACIRAGMLCILSLPLFAADASKPPRHWEFCDPMTLRTIAGAPQNGYQNGIIRYQTTGDGGPAIEALITHPSDIVVASDGTIYIAFPDSYSIRKITPDGIIHRVAGRYNEEANYADPTSYGDGGPALEARLRRTHALAIDQYDTLYLLDDMRIRKITSDGIIHTVAGTTSPIVQNYWFFTEPREQTRARFNYIGPATDAQLVVTAGQLRQRHSLGVAPNGTIYFLGDLGINKISPDGIISPVVAAGILGNDPAMAKVDEWIFNNMVVTPDGSVYASGSRDYRAGGILRISDNGAVSYVLGNEPNYLEYPAWPGLRFPLMSQQVGRINQDAPLDIMTLHTDRNGRLWWSGVMDGPQFRRLDDDDVVRWSGACQTHTPILRNVEDAPAGLDARSIEYAAAQCPDGSWVYSSAKWDDASSEWSDAFNYPVIRILDRKPPGKSPNMRVTPERITVEAAVGDAARYVSIVLANTGNMYGYCEGTCDQPWIWASFGADSYAPLEAGASGQAAFWLDLAKLTVPGVYHATLYVHTVGTNIPAQAIPIEVTMRGNLPLRDGGFETPALGQGNYRYNALGSPWAFMGAAGITAEYSGFTYAWTYAPEGAQIAFLQGQGSTISQSADLAAGTYTLEFWTTQRGNWQESWQSFRVTVDGVEVGIFRPVSYHWEAAKTASFAVGAGNHAIVFEGLNPNGGDNTAFIDNVVIIPVSPTTNG